MINDMRLNPNPTSQLVALDDGLQHSLGWKDNIQPFSAAKGNGTTEPVWSDMGNDLYAMKFTPNDELFVYFHIGHDYALGTDAFPHIHWLTDGTMSAGETVVWEFGYTIAKGHAQGQSLTGAKTTFQVIYTATGLEVAGEHIVTECSEAQAFDLIEPDTLVVISTKLISETIGGNVFGLMCDLHYQTNREDTPNKSPDFYV